ncbi:TonB-dependent receptor [Ancylomarina longa]|uniref:Outer membrane protein beta-barrel domain-containing protein n=1 Tax=Ancylomarina longa TaxID=2487017 RepID=A0A434AW18_9BACT|nr:TonB-dependent receptor [Ancylomarina longa]RUT78575.1 hypothetical protein DLK05_06970 [Ancylomarina longa]
MRKILFLLITLLTTHILAATNHIYGKLKDLDSKQPIEFASISVKTSENTIVCSMASNLKGEFDFETKPGNYNLEIRCMGYTTLQKTIQVDNQDVYLKTFEMKIDNKSIQEVQVVASSYKEKYDKSVQLITKQLKEGTNNLTDILTKIRGVNVDPLDNSIKVNNESKVLLLVDGVKKDQGYVKNLSPDRISRIEVTRNPTGRYISQGYNAVINVILKKNYSGLDLRAEEKGVFSLDNSNGDDFLISNDANIDFTFTHKKINTYGSYSNNVSNTNLPIQNEKRLDNISLIKNAVDHSTNSQKDGLTHSFVLGTDLFITSKQIISAETNISYSPFSKNHTTQKYQNTYTTNNLSESFLSELNNNQSEKAYHTLLSYQNQLSDKNKFEIDYGYNYIKNHLVNLYQEEADISTEQELFTDSHHSILEFNFQHRFSEEYALEIGYRNIYKSYDYNYSTTENAQTRNTDKRNLLYNYLSYTPKGKFKLKIGFAAEQNRLETSNQTKTYRSIQPFLNVFYKHSKQMNMSLKLNSDSEYPYANQISPFKITTDRLTSVTGNSNLTFATQYKSSIDIKLFGNKLSIEPFYHYTKDKISKNGQVIQDHFQYTYLNLDKHESRGFNIGTKLNIIPKSMFLNFTGSFYWDKIKHNSHTHHVNDFTINSNLIYISPKHKTLYALLLKKMNTKQIQAYGYENNDNDYLGCLIKKSFFKKKITATALYLLPVDLGLDYTMEEHFKYNSFREHNKVDVGLLKNLFMLKLSYNFRKGIEVKSVKKKNYKQKKAAKGFF